VDPEQMTSGRVLSCWGWGLNINVLPPPPLVRKRAQDPEHTFTCAALPLLEIYAGHTRRRQIRFTVAISDLNLGVENISINTFYISQTKTKGNLMSYEATD
jgi:hypothetical protein